MNKKVFFVVLLATVGPCVGFLFLQDSMVDQLEPSSYLQERSPSPTVPVATVSAEPEKLPEDDLQSETRGDSQLRMVSSGLSLTLSSEETPKNRREQAFSVMGLADKECSVYVAVFESESDFPKSERSSKTVMVTALDEQVHFSLDLPQDQPIAIAVFQDIDGNGKLSKNKMGAPTEPYGFSNNARGFLGPPSFKQAALILSPERNAREPINIKVR